MQISIGPNYAVVAWAMQRGAIARDASAPTFEVAPRQAQATQARMLATVDAQRRVIEHFDPDALSEGVPGWPGAVVPHRPGRQSAACGAPRDDHDPQQARRAMKELFPELAVGYVTRGTALKDATGNRVPVSWQWLERGR